MSAVRGTEVPHSCSAAAAGSRLQHESSSKRGPTAGLGLPWSSYSRLGLTRTCVCGGADTHKGCVHTLVHSKGWRRTRGLGAGSPLEQPQLDGAGGLLPGSCFLATSPWGKPRSWTAGRHRAEAVMLCAGQAGLREAARRVLGSTDRPCLAQAL